MTKDEALRLALQALEADKFDMVDDGCGHMEFPAVLAIAAIKQVLEQPEQPKARTGNCLLVGVCASEGHKIAPQSNPLTDEQLEKGRDQTNVRQLIADLLSALEYHTEQTRPIEFSRVAIEAAREYLKKPEPEPAAYGYCPECGAKGVMRERRPNGNDTCENGHVYPSNKPFGWVLDDKFYKVKQCRFFSKNPGEEIPNQIPVYTSPPKREWQGLTNEEIDACKVEWSEQWLHDFARAAEAKLKEKNT